MANIRTFQASFGAGEISPEMFGRIDDAKYRSGAAVMRNFIAKPQGPAENRAGFRFVRADVADAGAVGSVFEGVRADGGFDAVVNLAARAGIRPSTQTPRQCSPLDKLSQGRSPTGC